MKKFLIKVNGTQYEVEVEEVRDTAYVPQPAAAPKPAAEPVFVPVPDPRPGAAAPKAAAPEKKEAAPAGGVPVTAPMPGTVLKVSVNTGDTVKKGQPLLILEAMKMENEITSPADGKVAAVNVEKGKAVNAGDVMVVLG